MTAEITVRRAETPDDYRALQVAQRRAWGITEDSYVVPVATMVGAQHHGGLVLGAFLPSGEAVGMSFAFLGRVEGRIGLYSQLTGVVPGYQDRGIGHDLKMYQRSIARAEGIARIAWAFDPLQAGNARFNLDKLGATAGRYLVDMYGPRTDALNTDTPTDRLIAVWETDPAAPREPSAMLDLDQCPRLIAHAEPAASRVPEAAETLLLEIPADVNAMRQTAPALAGRWGRAVRQAFLDAFAAGYRAVGFVRDESTGVLRCYYVLRPAPNGSSDHSA